MTSKPDGKLTSESDDSRASDGAEADKRCDDAVKAADARVQVTANSEKAVINDMLRPPHQEYGHRHSWLPCLNDQPNLKLLRRACA
ncbi:hypothetical protein C8J35_111136 [Rhizobium sp. PP-F2F-G38]|nr:hypothetical protein C8J37_111104 [Rhizobium sp. PP-WC-1G-195]PYE94080.1 hypothetical protein C8J35_111136 [Rhizobium sp. PP-F2F-G38]TCQ01933.1 hypothetical protein C8J34_12419 [Rhizobium sp. PP-F2F-G36]TCQ20075.1 hypothetical protein C8J33_10843 [Rhizobium sp. PP-CC-3G-465]